MNIKIDLLPTKMSEVFGYPDGIYRYILLYGGRASGKSWFIALYVVLSIINGKYKKWMCVREVQKSIADSSLTLIMDTVKRYNIPHFTQVESKIYYRRGTKQQAEILFIGLSDRTAENLKSYEGYEACWIEEAQCITKRSFGILIPTIRPTRVKPIFFISMNPRSPSDYIYENFIYKDDPSCKRFKVNYTDNPYLDKNGSVYEHAETLRKNDIEEYLHIYEGHLSSLEDQFIGTDYLQQAVIDEDFYVQPIIPTIIGVDPAGDGPDYNVIALRQGLKCKILSKIQKIDPINMVQKIFECQKLYKCKHVALDSAFGNELRSTARVLNPKANYEWFLINFGAKGQQDTHKNFRYSMYENLRRWIIQDGGKFYSAGKKQDTTQLIKELMMLKANIIDSKSILISKEKIKKELGHSPDISDAIALTFAINDSNINNNKKMLNLKQPNNYFLTQ